jgi:hypothetical protein
VSNYFEQYRYFGELFQPYLLYMYHCLLILDIYPCNTIIYYTYRVTKGIINLQVAANAICFISKQLHKINSLLFSGMKVYQLPLGGRSFQSNIHNSVLISKICIKASNVQVYRFLSGY